MLEVELSCQLRGLSVCQGTVASDQMLPHWSFLGLSRASGMCWHAGRTVGIYPWCQPLSGLLIRSPVDCNKPLDPWLAHESGGQWDYNIIWRVKVRGIKRGCTSLIEPKNNNKYKQKETLWQFGKCDYFFICWDLDDYAEYERSQSGVKFSSPTVKSRAWPCS